MSLLIEQRFPLGRFHASRWRENAFADPYGEWPPSPWRLVRALAARWYQYSRETGDRDEEKIKRLLNTIASERPVYHLPESAFRGPSLKQYQPTGEFAWSDPSAGSGAVKQSKTTLFPDSYFAFTSTDQVIWRWETLLVPAEDLELLKELLTRITYFGRAESYSRLQLAQAEFAVNCQPSSGNDGVPVLCFKPNSPLRLDALLARYSDQKPVADVSVPPGTEWVFYQRPVRSVSQRQNAPRTSVSEAKPRYVQFSIGGHIYPPKRQWIRIAERFRGRVLRGIQEQPELRERLAGKNEDGTMMKTNHRHAYYLIWPDEYGNPARLIVWRPEPFSREELACLDKAAEKAISWADRRLSSKDSEQDRVVRLIPLPSATPLPKDMQGTSKQWTSATRFVRPANRHTRGRNGRTRLSEEPEQICARLIELNWGVRPIQIERIDSSALWVRLHESEAEKKTRLADGKRNAKAGPGFQLKITFEEPFQGPLMVGDSCHFGLGLFRADTNSSE